jgi:hypothetical protein
VKVLFIVYKSSKKKQTPRPMQQAFLSSMIEPETPFADDAISSEPIPYASLREGKEGRKNALAMLFRDHIPSCSLAMHVANPSSVPES